MIRRISSIKVKFKEKGMTCVFSSTAGRAAEQRKSAKKGGKGKSKGGNRLSRQEKSKRVKKQKRKS